MAKRFTDTDKWKDDWYISLSNDYKIIWQWLLDNCNHAGICKRSINSLNKMCDTKITEDELLNIMEGRIITCGGHWFIPNFLKFQYSTFFSNKPAVMSVVNELVKTNCYTMIPQSFGNHYFITQELINAIKNKDKDIKDLITSELHNYKIIVPEPLDNHLLMIKDKDTVKDKDNDKKDDEKVSEKTEYQVIQKSNSESLNEVKTYNHNDLLAFYKLPYLARTPEFKAMYSEILYERYQKVGDLIIQTYPNIRCNFMITIAEFKKIAALHTDEEIEGGLKKLSSSGNIKPDSLLHLRLVEYISYSIRDKEKGNNEKPSIRRENFN